MLRVGVMADTHFRKWDEGVGLLETLFQGPFKGIDLILHAGDFGCAELLDYFDPPKLCLVRGNTDSPMPGVPLRGIVEVDGFRIGMIHGWGAPGRLEERVLNEFVGENLDCIVFGHSHMPCNCLHQGVLLFNPGSPTDPRSAPFASVGVLEIDENVKGQIISLDGLKGRQG